MTEPYRYIGGEYAGLENSVIVTDPSGLTGAVQSNVAYYLNTPMDLGSGSITVPSGGMTIRGQGIDVTGITNDGTNPVFIGNNAGNLFLENLTIANSTAFGLTNASGLSTIECNAVNFAAQSSFGTPFNGPVDLGEVTGFRQMLFTSAGFFANLDGLDFSGTWAGGVAILDSIVGGLPSGVTLFKEGTSLSFEGSVRSNLNALSIDNNASVFGFQASNFVQDGGFSLNDFRTNTAANAIPNIAPSSVKANFKNCLGVANTYPGATWTVAAQATTTITVQGEYVKMAGTTTYANLAWFSGSVDNAAQKDTEQPLTVDVRGAPTFDLTTGFANTDQIAVQVYKYDADAAIFEPISDPFVNTAQGGFLITNTPEITFFASTEMKNKNDRIEIWIANLTGIQNITVLPGGACIISEKPS